MKEINPQFSHRTFSKWMNFRSPNHLLMIIQGKRNISWTSLPVYFKILKFNKKERNYFELLVKCNQTEDMALKAELFQEISSHWSVAGEKLQEAHLHYLSQWPLIAIREMVTLSNFKENGEWIRKKLGNKITAAQALGGIHKLLTLGLLKRNKNKKLIQSDSYITTGDETHAVAAFLYHQEMIRLAMESLQKKSSSERNITALTFTLKKDDYENLVHLIHDFRKKIIAWLQNRPEQNKDEDLYQLNMHLFPLTVKDKNL